MLSATPAEQDRSAFEGDSRGGILALCARLTLIMMCGDEVSTGSGSDPVPNGKRRCWHSKEVPA